MMFLIGKKKKKRIAARLGFLWHYIREIEDIREFAIATDILADLCVDLNVDIEMVIEASNVYKHVSDIERRMKDIFSTGDKSEPVAEPEGEEQDGQELA